MLKYYIFFFLLIVAALSGCQKKEFLDAKPDQAISTPTTLADFRAIIDNERILNGTIGVPGLIPVLGEIGSDYYTVTDDIFNGNISTTSRNAYIWNKEIYAEQEVIDWNKPYNAIYYANVVLDGLKKINISVSDTTERNDVRGAALFHRAHCYYQLAQVFCPPYPASQGENLLGLPLRLQATLDEKIERSTLQQTYDLITTDLTEALTLVTDQPRYKSRPGKAAVSGLLARVYLMMGDYPKAHAYATACLATYNSLMDYNNYDINALWPFPRDNEEIIFNASIIGTVLSSGPTSILEIYAKINDDLYQSYDDNDLRKSLYFKLFNGEIRFLGSYSAQFQLLFGGIATDEILLMRAECAARAGDAEAAMDDLNTLLQKRWSNQVVYTPLTASTPQQALQIILTERRKELLGRGLRWADLRRLNREGAGIILSRSVNGNSYTLSPNDARYTYPIPPSVIGFNPSMPQNQR